MRVRIDVELAEGELANASHIQQVLEALTPKVETRVTTDKLALTNRITEAVAAQKYDVICAELQERLCCPLAVEDTVEVLCSAALFSVQRCERGEPVEPFLSVITRLPDNVKEKVRSDVAQRAMAFLSTPRRLDCSRIPLMPYAETLAAMTKAELLSIRSVVFTIVQMVRLETTRTAGMTCLGKLVEISYEALRKCELSVLDALRSTVANVQQDDTFLYDVEYIMEAFGWSQNKSMLSLVRSGVHHTHSILTLAYYGGNGVNSREAVVTSSVDGTIGTWDRSGVLMENIVLSRHYASSLDLSNRGHTLIVGTVGRQTNTAPAVIVYREESTQRESRWGESAAVEPQNARFITNVRALRSSSTLRYGVSVSTTATSGTAGAHSLQVYEGTQLVQEYQEHSDIITALCVPAERESMLITGSRDKSVLIFDLRSRQAASCLNNHISTVTSVGTCAEYIITGGLDKRIVVEDLRMLGHPISRDMDSGVLSLSVNGTMQCAVSTLTGVYVINFQNGAQVPTSSRADSGPGAHRYNAISWNQNGNILYAGGDGKSLDVFRRSFQDGEGFEN